MSLKKKLGNIVWHIENNRGIIGDTKVLDQVLESLKGIESELPKDTAEVGQLISTGFMNGIRAQAGAPITVNESLRRIKYGEYNGHHQWDLAKDFFRCLMMRFLKFMVSILFQLVGFMMKRKAI